ncbi:MAG: DMT family transporter [Marinibacterium sp.]|nr:DMT family transporter [Marinibacterium sp.]
MTPRVTCAAALGAGLVVIYTGLISGADAITKLIAGGGYAAPQLYAMSGFVVALLCLLMNRLPSQRRGLGTTQPVAMALRSLATVIAAICFFYAFRYLPFADVFIFIGLMPLMAGMMSGLILREHVRPAAWVALGAGFVGILCLFPEGVHGLGIGHVSAIGASFFGTLSMVLARYIGRHEDNTLAQVLYPNLAIFVTMAVALPFVWVPMPLADLVWVLGYAGLLFLARWVLVMALRMLPAYTVTPLMNLQFVWMVALGALAFGELPTGATLLGVAIVIGSGLYLVWDQFAPERGPLVNADWVARLLSGFRTDP